VDVVIVVNIGTPLAGRDTLNCALGITAQMINILTEQNVQRSLASLGTRDILFAPLLGDFSATDFDKAGQAIDVGERDARRVVERLRALSVDEPTYARWRLEHPQQGQATAQLGFVAFEGSTITHPEQLARQLESQPGQPFDRQRAERDARTLAASGDYLRADYQLVSRDGVDGLVFDLEDKPWGPNDLRLGLDLSTDFGGSGTCNLKLSHNRHWLTQAGTEWRNRLQIGARPLVFTELYHPLKWTIGVSSDWFVAGYASAERRTGTIFDSNDDGDELARFARTSTRLGVDLGQPWGRFGELRLGLTAQRVRTRPTLISNLLGDVDVDTITTRESGLRLAAVVDQLDFANFPTAGYRIVSELTLGEGSYDGRFQRLEASALGVQTFGARSLSAFVLARGASAQVDNLVGRFSLGGFQQLSGYRDGQLLGNYVLLARLGWMIRLPYVPVAARAFFIGATAEAGNAWATRSSFRDGAVRTGMSLFVGADTGLGPLYLGLAHAPRGQSGVVLFLGRP
jgi:NTE family protein